MRKAFVLALISIALFFTVFCISQFAHDTHDQLTPWAVWVNLALSLFGFAALGAAVFTAIRRKNG